MTLNAETRKGQNPLLSHVLSMGLLIVLVGVIVVTLNDVQNNNREFAGRHEMRVACMLVKSGIEKVYAAEDYAAAGNLTIISRVVVTLPDKVGDRTYRVRFVNDSITVAMLGQPALNETCRIGFNTTYRGTTAGGRTEINYTKFTDGTELILMGKV